MRKKNVSSLEELIALAGEMGVRMIGCQMSMDVMGIRGTEWLMSEDPVAGWAEISVLEGSLKVLVMDWDSLPDSYFLDPLDKSIDTLDLDSVYASIPPGVKPEDALGIGPPVIVDAGYWTRVEAGSPAQAPMQGMAPGHEIICIDCCEIPEPSYLLPVGIGLRALTVVSEPELRREKWGTPSTRYRL